MSVSIPRDPAPRVWSVVGWRPCGASLVTLVLADGSGVRRIVRCSWSGPAPVAGLAVLL